MPWDNLENELGELFNCDQDYQADIKLEQWCRRQVEKQRNRDRRLYFKSRKEYWRAYFQRPEVKARISAHNATPERKLQRAAVQREYHARKRLDPEYVARRKEQRRTSAMRRAKGSRC